LSARPGERRATLILGRALLRERRWAEALPPWRELAQADPKAVEPQLQIARIARRLGDAPLGSEATERLLALAPDHAEGLELRRHFDAAAGLG
jgi:cytochrome c-type biogenesis protein CcmH/NrfG